MPKPANPKKKNSAYLNLNEPDLFDHIREVFERRKMPSLSLSYMVRAALNEWVEIENSMKGLQFIEEPKKKRG
jgi:hypothetical protein